MTFSEWFLFFLILQVIHFLGTWKLYVKAGRKAWEAGVPVYNAIILMQIINRPKWWVILLFIPVVNLLMFPIIWIETCRSFGFNKKPDTLLAVFTLGFYIYYINYLTDTPYIKDRSLQPNSALGEWVSSIAFAIIAATLVHTYFMQPYTIPTSSLEKTLLVGDYLFVSKFHYGARIPSTTIAAPMAHDTLPVLGTKSFISDDKNKDGFLNKTSLPYMRIPGFQKIKRNDIVVFSWPADSLKTMWGDKSGVATYKPIDKKTNYVKRATGIAGDTLEVRDGYVFINGKKTILPDRAKPQWYFKVDTQGVKLPMETINEFNINGEGKMSNDGIYYFNLTDDEAASLAKNSLVKSVTKRIRPKGTYDASVFPHSPKYAWSSDNFGPLYIPKAGSTVPLNEDTIPFYEQIIRRYENNNLTIFGDEIYINGKKATSYTFKQDYYWMMGDNRQNSLDARNWGYVPFDHVVGKPVLIWLSWNPNAPDFMSKINSIRWERMFTTVGGSGKPTSYLWLALLLITGYTLYSFKKDKKK
ncbi:signal peptidase I [Tenacibaculum finnmarkense genomovar finnmarkense]|uniref:signal peptidase I n=1 Tax=Tenacibaculum finnmarkense TaxID=2781243 RepID=UPI001E55C020|nr:signal peptidase I [Tenacibaculum finnmarkense]MCD8417785.1 signal peptidase I [Tenacibaculum finnmarkense genomovar finnmarkense]MCG8186173.1 signal peptidase I [Tenacibaculum finnmarkense genomovar finnmarkense]MCG8202697.1 signal peptidase I [Tenacibaculum finnmarkense genomovar finnmarkense]MCG8210091.1 signal peptidase I [Tenacibaculum finnmarkense genomovar finnmarkense]MCG8212977.1 signal peptidase I [Tenacibaculum finnmarkense genomovar finnmarkense]